MKLKKIAALLTAAVMSVGVMASCGGIFRRQDTPAVSHRKAVSRNEDKT